MMRQCVHAKNVARSCHQSDSVSDTYLQSTKSCSGTFQLVITKNVTRLVSSYIVPLEKQSWTAHIVLKNLMNNQTGNVSNRFGSTTESEITLWQKTLSVFQYLGRIDIPQAEPSGNKDEESNTGTARSQSTK